MLRVLPLARALSIGRTPDNGLPLRDPSVAIRHAEISAEGGALLLTHLAGGEHVTFVNGHRLAPNEPRRLEPGDEIQIGPFTLAFLTAAPETRPAPAPPDACANRGPRLPARPRAAAHLPAGSPGARHAGAVHRVPPALLPGIRVPVALPEDLRGDLGALQRRQDSVDMIF